MSPSYLHPLVHPVTPRSSDTARWRYTRRLRPVGGPRLGGMFRSRERRVLGPKSRAGRRRR